MIPRGSAASREKRTISALNHPHILVVYDVGEAEGRPFIVTELVEGQTLQQVMDERTVPVREAIDMGSALLPFWQARAWLREGRDAIH